MLDLDAEIVMKNFHGNDTNCSNPPTPPVIPKIKENNWWKWKIRVGRVSAIYFLFMSSSLQEHSQYKEFMQNELAESEYEKTLL